MSTNVSVEILRLEHAKDLPLPSYETPGAAGMDLRAATAEEEPVVIRPGGRTMVPTGFCIAVPEGYEAQVRPRSGLAIRSGITCLNSPGTVDSDYRGEVKVILANLGEENVVIRRGDRIAQLVICPVARAHWRETQTLDQTKRGSGGFGSTGGS